MSPATQRKSSTGSWEGKSIKGTWESMSGKSKPPFSVSTMLLLTDGTVMCQEAGLKRWARLSPNDYGDYVHGDWSPLSPMNNDRLYYASAVLPDGRVLVAGGEYSDDKNGTLDIDGNEGGWTNKCEIYDPQLEGLIVGPWSTIPSPDKWYHMGDAPCCVLPNGKVIVGKPREPPFPPGKIDVRTAIFDPAEGDPAKVWSSSANKDDSSSEETWTLLPNDTILSVECDNHPSVEKYIISEDRWVKDAPTPVDLVNAASGEIGPAIVLPDKRVFVIGATGHTALYTMPLIADQPGTWVAGPDFPKDASGQPMQAKDAPACLLPNGRVLCVAGPADNTSEGYPGPMSFFEFDGKSINPVLTPPNAHITRPKPPAPYVGRMLLLPTGQVLFSAESQELCVYNPDGASDASWRPKITSLPAGSKFNGGKSYHLAGQQLNGLSQAVSYGDDASMATNYPLVRIKNKSSDKVWYCRTFNHSTMGIATGTLTHSTNFAVPYEIEDGKAELCVIANGISSECIPITTRAYRIPRVITAMSKSIIRAKVRIDEGIHIGGLVDGQLWILTRHGFVPVGPWNPNELVKGTRKVYKDIANAIETLQNLGNTRVE